ncbi:MAG TPA: phosphoribosyl-ATP diphosphatase [Azospirillaceae bacterium]|nr:phosphoribosyl-ATP diphosphatase [Azospirillaceae bacterium]
MSRDGKGREEQGREEQGREEKPGPEVLDLLHRTILSRRGADPESSHTARLFARGRAKIAQKVGEEAVETVIEAIRGDRAKLAEESADLLYHLLVLWADAGVEPAEVYAILDGRRGVSGVEEKKNRKR